MPDKKDPSTYPYATVDKGLLPLSNMDDAVNSVYSAVRSLSKPGAQEYAGAFFKNSQGQYTYTTPIQGSNDEFAYRLQIPKDHTFAGVYHTHPAEQGGLSQRFSQNDIETIKRLGVPSYIMNMDNFNIGRMTPEQAARVRPGDYRAGNNRLLGDVLRALSNPAAPPAEVLATK